MDEPRIPRKDDPITADGQRRLVAAVLQAMRISGGPGILVKRHPAGITISAIPRRELATGTGAGTTGTGGATEGDADPSGSDQKSIETADGRLQLYNFDDLTQTGWTWPTPADADFAVRREQMKMLVREAKTGETVLRYAPVPYTEEGDYSGDVLVWDAVKSAYVRRKTESMAVVTDVEWDGTSGKLIQHKRTVLAILPEDADYGETATETDIVQYIECEFGEETV
jgi:hypothetical protein